MTAEELATTLEVYARYRDDNKGSALRAAAMLRQQAEQIESLKQQYEDSMRHQNNAYNQRVAERDALKADAERYRKLCNSGYVYLSEGLDDSGWCPSYGTDVDEFLDAMKGKT